MFGDKAVKISGNLGEEVISYIDDDYVGSALSDEYRYKGIPEEFADYSDNDLGSLDSEEIDMDLDYSGDVFHASSVRPSRGLSPHKLGVAFDKEVKSLKSLDDVLKGIYKDSFEKHLQKLINKKGLKNSEVYAAANISKQYFSKLLKKQEEYEQDKARKFKIFNDWAKDFKEKHTVEASSIKEYLEDDKIYDTDKYVYVCPHCFEERTECVCDECKEYIEIDRNIYPAIRNLNRAGYRTAFCCEGHKKEYPFGNIVFSHFYHFDHIPDFCRYSHNGNLEFCYEGSTDEEFEADKKKKLEELIAWSESFLK